jgi:hypothetical protein
VQQGGVALFAWRKDNAVIDICHPRIAKIAKKVQFHASNRTIFAISVSLLGQSCENHGTAPGANSAVAPSSGATSPAYPSSSIDALIAL